MADDTDRDDRVMDLRAMTIDAIGLGRPALSIWNELMREE